MRPDTAEPVFANRADRSEMIPATASPTQAIKNRTLRFRLSIITSVQTDRWAMTSPMKIQWGSTPFW